MSIGEKIKNARIQMGLTQQELGDAIGVQKSAIAKYENGRVVNIKRSTLQKIASTLKMRPSELVFEDLPEVAADFHVRVLTDYELMNTLKVYYDLSSDKQKMIRELIHSMKK